MKTMLTISQPPFFSNPLVPCDAITIPKLDLYPWKEEHYAHKPVHHHAAPAAPYHHTPTSAAYHKPAHAPTASYAPYTPAPAAPYAPYSPAPTPYSPAAPYTPYSVAAATAPQTEIKSFVHTFNPGK